MPNRIEAIPKQFSGKFEKLRGSETITRKNIEIPGNGEAEIILLNKKVICCIDSRDSAPLNLEQKNHAGKTMYDHPYDGIKFPGGTIGLFFVAGAAIPELAADKIVKLVKEFEKDQGRTAAFHDDIHPNTCGCGHVAKAAGMENPSIYGISSQRVNEIKKAFADEIRGGMPVNKAILTGHHEEEAVLIVSSNGEINETVKSADPNKRFFIYDETASHEILKKLAKFSQGKNIEVTEEDLIATADKQAGATLSLLAAGLPLFEIDLTDPVPKVTPKGKVPALA